MLCLCGAGTVFAAQLAASPAAKPASEAASGTMRQGPDPGMVNTPPPAGDVPIAQPPPRNVDPSILQAPAPDAQTPSGTPERNPAAGSGKSRQDDCRGPAELCRQDSAR